MRVDEAGKAFIEYCANERYLSANTVSAYSQDMCELGRPLGSSPAWRVSGQDLLDYVAYLSETRRLAPATLKRRLACVRSFFAWLKRKCLVKVNPFSGIEIRIRIPDRLPRCLSMDEMSCLARAAEHAPVLTRLAALLLFSTGARVGELAAIKVADVDARRGVIRIVGKGDRERQVFVPNFAV